MYIKTVILIARSKISKKKRTVEDVASRCLSSKASRCWSSLVLSSPSARSDTAHVAISDDIASALYTKHDVSHPIARTCGN